MTITIFEIKRNKSNLPTFSESGGGATNTGNAFGICDKNGNPKTPIFIPNGHSNGDHAIFVVNVGDYIGKYYHNRKEDWFGVYIVEEIKEKEIVCSLVGEYENGDSTLEDKFLNFQKAMGNKSHCYHCREPHFYKKD